MLQYGWPHRRILYAAFACMAVLGATTGAYAYLMGPALRFLLSGGSEGLGLPAKLIPALATMDRRAALWFFPGVIIAIGVAKGIAYLGQFYWMGIFGQRVTLDVRREFFARLCRLSPAQLSRQLSGDLLSRFSSDMASLELAATYTVASYVRDGLQILTLVGVAFLLDWRVALVAALVVPVAALPVSRLMRRVLRKLQEAHARLGQVAGQMMEGLGAVKTIQAFNGREAELARFEKQVTLHRSAIVRAAWSRSAIPGLMEILAAVVIAAVLGVAASGRWMSPEKLVSLLSAIVLIYQPVKDLGRMGQFGIQAGIAAERIFKFLDLPLAVPTPPGAIALPTLHRAIQFDQVSFSYGDRPALKELTVTLPVGKTTALVGPSGAGKSTLTSLLLRFERPQSGRILFDDVDLDTASPESIRAQFALVTQEPLLFSATIFDNIRFARPSAPFDEVVAAARTADADDFIRAFPRGYDTQVGERGVMLSGGQKQRICLARAILARAPVLVLDEATSNLDPYSEKAVQVALERILPGRTALVIAHRLITVQGADCIHVLDDGRVVETGTHAELLRRGGLYARLWDLQQSASPSPSYVA